MSAEPAPALKEIFDAACFRAIAAKTAAIDPRFDQKQFLGLALDGLDELSLMQRLRRMSDSLHATLPAGYPRALAILRRLAPTIDRGFVTLALCDFVGRHGRDDFDRSLDALKFLTAFGSAEFAIREFLRLDLFRALAVMETWSRDPDEHVRRLASEGSRPRLPWSFRLDALVADPAPTAPILENLRADPSLYVRKSVANHLNDITKDHPAAVLDRLEGWPRDDARTRWIARHALRTLIKRGDRRALAVIGAGEPPDVALHDFALAPNRLHLGGRLTMTFRLESRAARPQRLVVDYRVHYVKRAENRTSGKVFKLKELTLAPGETVALAKTQVFRDFTTRTHHPGRHDVEILVNGESLARESFELLR
jgi:3-methyladenine DNA glycosylase AlkC